MKGWRARLGFLDPAGQSDHRVRNAGDGAARRVGAFLPHGGPGEGGTLDGQEERNRSQIAHIDDSADMLVKVKPDVMMLAHTASSYTLGRRAEAELLERLQARYRSSVATAFGSVVQLSTRWRAADCARGALHGGDHAQGQGAARRARLCGREPSRARKRNEHLRRDAGACLPARPLGGQAGGGCGVSQRARHANDPDLQSWKPTSASRRSPPHRP